MKSYLPSVLLILIIWLPENASSEKITNVHIAVDGQRSGKGIAVSRGLECFVLTAAHVVEHPIPIMVYGVQTKRSPAEVYWSDGGIDLAVIRVKQPAEICGRDFFLDIKRIEERLRQNRSGLFSFRNEEGSEYEIPVKLASFDDTYIYIESESRGLLGESLSGSILYVSGTPAGLLVTVSTGQTESGRVLRIDRINERVGSFLPLTEPPEQQARLDDKLAADILRKHLNYMQTEDFCRNFLRLAKWVAKPEGQTYNYTTKRRGPLGDDEYLIESMLFPGVQSVFTKGSKAKDRSVETRVGFVPSSMALDEVWNLAERSIEKCLKSDIRKEIGNIRIRSEMRRNNVGKRSEWAVERTSAWGVSKERVHVWLDFGVREIKLHVWSYD